MVNNEPQLGVFTLTVAPVCDCTVSSAPPRLMHAALLRRLELVNPDLSMRLHDSPDSVSSIEKPWTITMIPDNYQMVKERLFFTAGRHIQFRITVLTAEVCRCLQAAFDQQSPLGQEPLILGKTVCIPVKEECRWDALTTYASLLTMSRPLKDFILEFRTPVGFRNQSAKRLKPEPFRCIQGYLRKWNAFSELLMETEPIHRFAQEHLSITSSVIKNYVLDFNRYYQMGWTGRVTWKADDETSFPLRMVNALVNYSYFCGTGMKTTHGMGHTIRIFSD